MLPFHSYKVAKRHVNLRVGDVCLLKYENKVKSDYRYCMITEVFPDGEGAVRTVKVKLRPRDKRDQNLPYKHKSPVIMEVGVQRLVLIVAAEDTGGGADEDSVDGSTLDTGADPIVDTGGD